MAFAKARKQRCEYFTHSPVLYAGPPKSSRSGAMVAQTSFLEARSYHGLGQAGVGAAPLGAEPAFITSGGYIRHSAMNAWSPAPSWRARY